MPGTFHRIKIPLHSTCSTNLSLKNGPHLNEQLFSCAMLLPSKTSLPELSYLPHGEWYMLGIKRVFLLLILTGLFFIPVIGDVPIEGMKQYNYQYVINNTVEYQDYIFLTSSEIWNFEHPSIVVNGTFSGGYKLDGFVLHAMKESDLDPRIIDQLRTEEQERTDLTQYFSSVPLATAALDLPVATSIEDTIPLSNISVRLQIESIHGNELNITKTQMIYGFENGTTIDIPFQEDVNDPKPGDPGT